MTACLLYPSHANYTSFSPVRLQARHHHAHLPGNHSHHLPPAPQEAPVDLRPGAMLEEPRNQRGVVSASAAVSMFTATSADGALHGVPAPAHPMTVSGSFELSATGSHGLPVPKLPGSPQEGIAETPDDAAATQTARSGVIFSPRRPEATPPETASQAFHSRNYHPDNHAMSPLSGDNVSSLQHLNHIQHQQHHHLDDARNLQSVLGSPHSSAILSDNEDEYVDMDMDKSDSGGDSPHRKRSSSTGAISSGNGSGSGEKKVYHCQHCKYITDRKNNLKRHVVTMHEMCPKTLECCDVVFKNKASLRDHVVSCHKNGYDCRICGRTFCRKALLKRHITVHSGQKDYVCGVCGYATSHKSNLDRHKRRHGPKFSGGSGGDDLSDRACSKSPTPITIQQLHSSPFTPNHKSNPLDVSNLVNNNGNNSRSPNHPNRGFGGSPDGYFSSITTIHRPEPLKPTLFCSLPTTSLPTLCASSPPTLSLPCSLQHDQRIPTHQELAEDAASPTGNTGRKIRPAGRYMLSKRLLYTYGIDHGRSGKNSDNKDYNDNGSSNNNDDQNNKNNNNNNCVDDDSVLCDVNKNQRDRLTHNDQNSHQDLDKKVRFGLEKRLSAQLRLWKHNRKLRLSTKRLYPALYMCRRCSVIYENQLQLTEHVENKHRDDDCPNLPQRPLTLQARTRAW